MNLERHVLGLNHERLFPIYAFFDVTFPSGVYEFSFLCVCVCVCVCVCFYIIIIVVVVVILILAAVLGRNWN